MNGSVRNWLTHAGIALAIQLMTALATGSLLYGAVLAVWGFWWREAGEFSVKHWDAPHRPLSDFIPFDRRRSRDDRLDLLFPVVAVLIPLTVAAVL